MKRYKFPELYSLSKLGEIRHFYLYVEDDENGLATTYTEKWQGENGKKLIDKYEYRTGKNIGKSNETSYIEQALSEAKSIWRKQRDKGYQKEKPKKEDKYNTDASGNMKPMLAQKWNSKLVKYPCFVETKVDGLRTLSFEDEKGNVHIISRQGKELNIPHIKKWLENNKWILPLDGELYVKDELSFQEIVSAAKKLTENTSKLKILVYDKPVKDKSCFERKSMLCKDFEKVDKDAPIYLVKSYIANSFEDIDEKHEEFVSDGWEGAIIRNYDGEYEFGYRSNNLIKYKKFIDEEFIITDVEEATGRDAGTGIFVLKTPDGKKFKARPKGSIQLRTDYLKNKNKYIGALGTVKFFGWTDDELPRFPVFIAVRDYE